MAAENQASCLLMASVIEKLSDAVVLLLEKGEAAGAFSQAIVTEREYDPDHALEDDIISVITVPDFATRKRESNGTYIRYVRLDVTIRKRFSQSDYKQPPAEEGIEKTAIDPYIELLEQIDNYMAHPDNQVPFAMTEAEYIEPGDKDVDREVTRKLGIHWLTEDLRTMHQFTGIVRVAYEVTEAY